MKDPEFAAARSWARKLTVAALIAGLALSTAACSTKKSEAELASEALRKGLAAHRAGNLPEAAAEYRQVLVYDPNSKEAYYNLGLIDQTNGALASADSNYTLALSIDPSYVPALYNLAIVKTATGDSEAAIKLYREAIRSDRTYAAAHLNLGFALIEKGQKREGRAQLAIAVKLDPSLASRIPDNATGAEGDTGGGGSETPSESPA
jgi:tetratricopeptide (TPR) repeat protein